MRRTQDSGKDINEKLFMRVGGSVHRNWEESEILDMEYVQLTKVQSQCWGAQLG